MLHFDKQLETFLVTRMCYYGYGRFGRCATRFFFFLTQSYRPIPRTIIRFGVLPSFPLSLSFFLALATSFSLPCALSFSHLSTLLSVQLPFCFAEQVRASVVLHTVTVSCGVSETQLHDMTEWAHVVKSTIIIRVADEPNRTEEAARDIWSRILSKPKMTREDLE